MKILSVQFLTCHYFMVRSSCEYSYTYDNIKFFGYSSSVGLSVLVSYYYYLVDIIDRGYDAPTVLLQICGFTECRGMLDRIGEFQ